MSKLNVLLAVTGSIACYKSCYLISKLKKADMDIKVVPTESALKFVGEASYEGLTRNKVYKSTFEEGDMMSHIDLPKWADVIIIYPASANTISKLATGQSDNLLLELSLVNNFNKPIWIAPAMNSNMYENPITQENLSKLEKLGAFIFQTETGILACGDTGPGKLVDPVFVYEKLLEEFKGKLG